MPPLQEQIDNLKRELEASIRGHRHNGNEGQQVNSSELFGVPTESIADPTGGGTVDAEARTAINALIDRLESLGLVKPN